MKNDKAMNFTTATKLDLAIAEAQGKVTVKRLKTRGPRKGEAHYTGSPAQGAGRPNKEAFQSGNQIASSGSQWVGNQAGIGAGMVSNLSGVKRNYARQAESDRRAAARDRAAGKLDILLADIRG